MLLVDAMVVIMLTRSCILVTKSSDETLGKVVVVFKVLGVVALVIVRVRGRVVAVVVVMGAALSWTMGTRWEVESGLASRIVTGLTVALTGAASCTAVSCMRARKNV